MSLEYYFWRVTRQDNGVYETAVSATAPTVAPSDGGAIISDQTIVLDVQFFSIVNPGYVNIQSTLSDNQAIKIHASDTNGGIDIDAGFGGITIDSTNTISLNAAAASDFTTTNGNLTLQATAGLTNIESGSGINVGIGNAAYPINIGTSGAKNITLGNSLATTSISGQSFSLSGNGATSTISLATTGNAQDLNIFVTGSTDSSVHIQSSGTGADAIKINSVGGLDLDTDGAFNLLALNSTANAISLNTSGTGGTTCTNGSGGFTVSTTGQALLYSDQVSGSAVALTTGANGGISLSSGSQGIAINANGNLIGIGGFSGGNIDIGTAAVARTITIGNTVSGSAIKLKAPVTLTQPAHTVLADSNVTLTMAQVLTEVLTMNPTVARNITMPTAANIVAAVSGIAVGDSFPFSIINTAGLLAPLTLVMNTGGTLLGNATITVSSSASFRMRMTNVSSGTEAYTVYCIA